jgi:hypothetical protein
MIEFIVSQFSDISKKAITRFSGSYETTPQNVQISFSLKPIIVEDENKEKKVDYDVVYKVYKDYQKVEDVTFLNILGVRIDFKGYSYIAPPFIQKTLIRFANELGVNCQNVFVMLYLNDENALKLNLYNLGELVKSVELEDLFTNET